MSNHAPAADEAALQEERLKSALWFALGQYVDSHCLSSNLNATPQFIGALTELVYAQISSAAKDLSTFARHAGRTQVKTEDVILLARRNESLELILRRFGEEWRRERGVGMEGADKGRGRVEKSTGGRGRGRGRGGAARGAAVGRGRGRPRKTD